MRRGLAVTAVSLMVLAPLLWAEDASARAGGGGFSGSRGSRSYSAPSPKPSPGPRMASPPSSPPAGAAIGQTPSRAGSGGLGGFLAGGLLGGLLFGGSGAGMGLPDIAGLGLLAYLAVRLLRSRSSEPAPGQAGGGVARGHDALPTPSPRPGPAAWESPASAGDSDRGIDRIRRNDPGFDEPTLARIASDIFVKVQAAWSARDVRPISALLTPEMLLLVQRDCEKMKSEGRWNRIEGISMRAADVVEAWQEKGQDYVTVRVAAGVLDYTTDERTGQVIEGSASAPVTFEEFWTFTRPVWAKSWRLSAIQQPVPAAS